MPYRPKLGPRPNGIKGDRQKGLPWTVWRSSVHAKHVQDANGCHHRCAGLPPPQHVCLWGMRQLIGSVKAFLRGADTAPLEVNARASLYFKGTVLTFYYMPWRLVVLWCDHLVPSQAHNYCFCCSKCASQRSLYNFFP